MALPNGSNLVSLVNYCFCGHHSFSIQEPMDCGMFSPLQRWGCVMLPIREKEVSLMNVVLIGLHHILKYNVVLPVVEIMSPSFQVININTFR